MASAGDASLFERLRLERWPGAGGLRVEAAADVAQQRPTRPPTLDDLPLYVGQALEAAIAAILKLRCEGTLDNQAAAEGLVKDVVLAAFTAGAAPHYAPPPCESTLAQVSSSAPAPPANSADTSGRAHLQDDSEDPCNRSPLVAPRSEDDRRNEMRQLGISKNACNALVSIDCDTADNIVDDLRRRGKEVRNPSGWVMRAVQKAGAEKQKRQRPTSEDERLAIAIRMSEEQQVADEKRRKENEDERLAIAIMMSEEQQVADEKRRKENEERKSPGSSLAAHASSSQPASSSAALALSVGVPEPSPKPEPSVDNGPRADQAKVPQDTVVEEEMQERKSPGISLAAHASSSQLASSNAALALSVGVPQPSPKLEPFVDNGPRADQAKGPQDAVVEEETQELPSHGKPLATQADPLIQCQDDFLDGTTQDCRRGDNQSRGGTCETEGFHRRLKNMLRKPTPSKVAQYFEQVAKCTDAACADAIRVIQEMFDKGTTDHSLIPKYIKLVHHMDDWFDEHVQVFKFPELLSDKFQGLFVEALRLLSVTGKQRKAQITIQQHKIMGFVDFVCQLLAQRLIDTKVLVWCALQLLSIEPMSHEAAKPLARLLETTGPAFDTEDYMYRRAYVLMFAKLATLASDNKVPDNAVRIVNRLLQLRENGWVDKKFAVAG